MNRTMNDFLFNVVTTGTRAVERARRITEIDDELARPTVDGPSRERLLRERDAIVRGARALRHAISSSR